MCDSEDDGNPKSCKIHLYADGSAYTLTMSKSRWHQKMGNIYQGGISPGSAFIPPHLVFPDGDKSRDSHLTGNQYQSNDNGYLHAIPGHSDRFANSLNAHPCPGGYHNTKNTSTSHDVRGNYPGGDLSRHNYPYGNNNNNNKKNNNKNINKNNKNFFKFPDVHIEDELEEIPEPDYDSDYSDQSDSQRSEVKVTTVGGRAQQSIEDPPKDKISRPGPFRPAHRTWDVFHTSTGDPFSSTSDNSATYLLMTASIKIIFAAVCLSLVLLSATASRLILIATTYFLRPKQSDWIARSFESQSNLSPPVAAVLSRADSAVDVKPAHRTWDVFHTSTGDPFSSTSDNSATYLLMTASIKIIFAAVCLSLVLLSATASRLILIATTYFLRPKQSDWIARSFESQSNLSPPVAAVLSRADSAVDVKWVWAILIIIVTPYILNSCSAAWRVVFKTTGKLKFGALLAVRF
ncbi:hypothetical protein EGW08_021686 [Elysia chlorotica]|uniref:Uncharacterized protein n=1 Tax=Elysia chlorotica TaxID=188477 RepID=A0A433SN15_ELYCH|nr:hypothetical protein EGW08_021686 [Elysia chlorotica]